MDKAKAENIPLTSHFKLSHKLFPSTNEEKFSMKNILYSSAVGSLMNEYQRLQKEAGMATKVDEATTIRMVEISKKETGRIRENTGTKATKEKYGHYFSDCPEKHKNQETYAKLAEYEEDEETLLMVTTRDEERFKDQ
ncbi:hypothetical protein KIW84_055603 [Lathyrus oleraceus]|uniref:Uncharacterized protein n=1 Tax=Pisum sativum TaxID=3888 RepID=A0A9D5AJZ5_PEA|nr:hypothetical protein KIW84_055603 [Pisum sativum]